MGGADEGRATGVDPRPEEAFVEASGFSLALIVTRVPRVDEGRAAEERLGEAFVEAFVDASGEAVDTRDPRGFGMEGKQSLVILSQEKQALQ